MGNTSMKLLQKLEPKRSQIMLTGWSFEIMDPEICFDIPNSIPNRMKILRRRKTNSCENKQNKVHQNLTIQIIIIEKN